MDLHDFRENMDKLLYQACLQLHEAANGLARECCIPVPEPRPRFFTLAPGVVWPAVERPLGVQWTKVLIGNSVYSLNDMWTASRIGACCDWRPRKVLRAIRRMEVAAEWCRKRQRGRQRQLEELLLQQERAIKVLRQCQALEDLLGGGEK